MYRYRKAFGYLLRTLCWMALFLLFMEYGFGFISDFLQLEIDSRYKSFGLLIGLNLILVLSLPATLKEIQRIRQESRFHS